MVNTKIDSSEPIKFTIPQDGVLSPSSQTTQITDSTGERIDVPEQQVTPTEAPSTTVPKFSHERLLLALYYIWDAFERTNMPFFLVYSTAESVMAQRSLVGDCIQVGVRRNEWISGARRILDAFALPKTETDTEALYEFEDIPIKLYIYEELDDCIVQTQMVRYAAEEFMVPNTYEKFLEVYGRR